MWTENILKTEPFDNDDVTIITWLPYPECSQTQIQNDWWNIFRVKSFSNSFSEVWTGLKLRYVLNFSTAMLFSKKNPSFNSPTGSVHPRPRSANSGGAGYKVNLASTSKYVFFSRLRRKWRLFEYAYASYPQLCFRPHGFNRYKVQEESIAQGLVYVHSFVTVLPF